jgi:Helix-turn-helix
MSEPQIIRTPSGDELVVLSRAEYDALLARADEAAEDEDDVAMYDARKEELAAGGETLPAEVSALMLRGYSLLAAIRKWRDMTQLHVNFKTNIGQGYLSDLESGRRAGSKETLELLAKCYDVPASWLVDKTGA